MLFRSPRYVIVSNDHSVDCRSLLAVARYLDIKTVYMQHASVSDVFPALTVDYAFLDGNAALNTYLLCEKNQPDTAKRRNHPAVFLSGQKKPLKINKAKKNTHIGVATNRLDNPALIIELVSYLSGQGFPVSLRWHPRQLADDVALFNKHFDSIPLVTLSEPGSQSIDDYLSSLSHLISGNSSILLEAAISGAVPLYHEVQPPFIEDYYGYVQHGLAKKLDTRESIVDFINTKGVHGPDPAAVRYYSATYDTQWHGKEGELVATSLTTLEEGQGVEQLWGFTLFATH